MEPLSTDEIINVIGPIIEEYAKPSNQEEEWDQSFSKVLKFNDATISKIIAEAEKKLNITISDKTNIDDINVLAKRLQNSQEFS